MVRVKLMDGSVKEIEREVISGVYPCQHLFSHPQLKSDAVLYLNGKIYPVLGPLPARGSEPWILLFETHGQVIDGLPVFDDDAAFSPDTAGTNEESLLLKIA
jgi:hypothetical protein